MKWRILGPNEITHKDDYYIYRKYFSQNLAQQEHNRLSNWPYDIGRTVGECTKHDSGMLIIRRYKDYSIII